jgi:hypothetical protein
MDACIRWLVAVLVITLCARPKAAEAQTQTDSTPCPFIAAEQARDAFTTAGYMADPIAETRTISVPSQLASTGAPASFELERQGPSALVPRRTTNRPSSHHKWPQNAGIVAGPLLLPPPKGVGRPRLHQASRDLECHLLRGMDWLRLALASHEFPAWQTAYHNFRLWRALMLTTRHCHMTQWPVTRTPCS